MVCCMVSKLEYIANVLSTLRKASRFVGYVSTGMLVEFVPAKKVQRRYIDLCSRLVRLEAEIDSIIKEMEVVDMI